MGGVLLILAALALNWRRRHAQLTALGRAQACLTWLPVLSLGVRLLQVYWPVLSGNLLYFGAPAIMAWALNAGYTPAPVESPGRGASRREWVLITLVFTLFYWLLGWHVTSTIGDHTGDECHFVVQAESLYHDHDLDIRNNVGNPPDDVMSLLHVSPNSRQGHWYSWHTPGLSFLLAPTVPYGLLGRHLMLGLLSGLGLAAFYSLCRRLARDTATAVVLLVLMSLSALWGVYSCRVLPEILGMALTLCGVLTILNRTERPWASLVLLLVLLAALPFAYARFLPVAVVLGGCYGLFELLEPRPWRQKLLRLVLLIGGSLAGVLLFFCFQASLFGWHLKQAHSDAAFGFAPIFAWHSLASGRGILYSFPLFACALPACFCLLFRRSHWRYGLTATLVFLVILLTWGSCSWFHGGASLPGRYLAVTIPLLTAALAVVLPAARGAFRWLVFFLGLFSVTMFLTELVVLPYLLNSFCTPYDVDIVHPLFDRLLRLLYDPYESTHWLPTLTLLVGVSLLLLRPGWPRWAQLSIMLLIGIAFFTHVPPTPTISSLQSDGSILGPTYPVWVSGHTQGTCSLWQGHPPYRWATPIITTQAPGTNAPRTLIRYDQMAQNDWEQRGYRWAALTELLPPSKGWRVIGLASQLDSDAAAEFVIREGTQILASKKFPPHTAVREVFSFRTEKRGPLQFLVRLEGDGTWQAGVLAISAYDPALLKKANLTLPNVAEIPDRP
ncbi:MAG: hypothetical protein NTY53_14580 [Kiritimatiellaeota bacterium]|nr:hypothetical protein [Kiritimatiellota bacterium]